MINLGLNLVGEVTDALCLRFDLRESITSFTRPFSSASLRLGA